jgi:hypothetical protein
MSEIEIGRLLRASTTACVVGCRVSQANTPAFGGLVRIPLDDHYGIYGLIYDIRIEDDGLVRQLVTADGVDEDIIQDNRMNRNVPVEVSVLHVGYRQSGQIYHLLPPRPPLSLDAIYICGAKEACSFTEAGRFGYFRHILRAADLPVGELLAAHIQLIHGFQKEQHHDQWASEAVQELITLLRDDYPTLMSVLGTLADAAR